LPTANKLLLQAANTEIGVAAGEPVAGELSISVFAAWASESDFQNSA
jgi:hypothetical protein